MEHMSKPIGLKIFTIGHSNHAPDVFLELLRQHSIHIVVDVRSKPYSKYATHFCKDELEDSLPAGGFRYIFLGNELGGMPKDRAYYDADGYVLYGELAASRQFQRGIGRLLEAASMWRVALMCGEEDPTRCHRRHLIGLVLGERGVTVLHIRGDGTVESQTALAHRDEMERQGQQSLFEDETASWRSTGPVATAE